MRKISTKLIIGMSVLLFFLGCQIPRTATEGSLKLTINNEINSKTLVPGLDIEPAYYNIWANGPEDASFDVNTTNGDVTIGFLRFGDWYVSVDAYNADGVVIARGREKVTVHVEEVITAAITIRLLQGFGSLNLNVSWYTNEVENPSITGVLKPSEGNDTVLTFYGSEGDIGTENVFTDTGNTLRTGYHTLILQVKDLGASGTADHLALGAVEIVRILNNQTTYGDYFLQGVPGMGKIDVNIEQDFNNPIEVSILPTYGNSTILPASMAFDGGQRLWVKADVPADDEDAGNLTYVWYLNGESFSVDHNITLDMDNSPLSTTIDGKYVPGNYRLDVTVFNIDGSRAGSARYEFEVTGNPAEIVAVTGEVVNFTDPNFEIKVREAINKPEGDIYDTDLVELTSLTATSSAISDISGIEYCINLERLYLRDNNITDISKIQNLTNITFLSLENNQLTDISALTNLNKLFTLLMTNCGVADFSPISGLTSIGELFIANNPISDFSFLTGLTKIWGMSLNSTGISDLSVLENLIHVTNIGLADNNITDISPLAGMRLDHALDITNNNLDFADDGGQGTINLNTLNDILARCVNVKYEEGNIGLPPRM